jgi:hypothetical protein
VPIQLVNQQQHQQQQIFIVEQGGGRQQLIQVQPDQREPPTKKMRTERAIDRGLFHFSISSFVSFRRHSREIFSSVPRNGEILG